MSLSDKTYDDEIDLIEWKQTVWDGKWKIASIVAVSLLSVFGLNIVKPNTTFTASTEIKPITSFEFDKYSLFNATGVFEIKREDLLNLYIEKIKEGSLLETAFDKFNLINKDDFDNESDYRDTIEKFVSQIEVLRPIEEKNETNLHYTLQAEYDDKDKWKELLSFVNNEANRKVKASIINRFSTILSIQKQKKNFALKDTDIAIENAKKDFEKKMKQFELEQQFKLEDVNIEIENAKKDFDKKMEQFELEQQFKLEDVTTQIDNATKDYDRITKDRLAFLSEQAAIARKLGVKKNTIESQMFDTQNTVVTNIKTNTPFYLRGYEAIEEEINLIKGRKDKISFVRNLFKLEQQKRTLVQDKTLQRAEKKKIFLESLLALEVKKRAIEQDKTLQRAEKNKVFLESLLALEAKKRAIEQDETIERAVDLFNKTPLTRSEFKSTLVKVATTDFEINNKINLYYALAIVLGGILGVVYVLIANAFRNRRTLLTNS